MRREGDTCLSPGATQGRVSGLRTLQNPQNHTPINIRQREKIHKHMIVITKKNYSHVIEAVNHYNNALDDLDKDMPVVACCETLYKALNKLQTAWINDNTHIQRKPQTESKSFIQLIDNSLVGKNRPDFLTKNELINFIELSPPVMNHRILKDANYDPMNIDPGLAKEASAVHRELKECYLKYTRERNPKYQNDIISKTGNLLYIIRSNIAHGEKTPKGPDLKKMERDIAVSKVSIPLLMYLFKSIIGEPDQYLIAYGTIAPGNINHGILSDLKGEWSRCKINGKINDINRLPVFHWALDEKPIDTDLFYSKDLPVNWPNIDKFEGSMYKRRLIPAEIFDNNFIVGNIYLGSTD